ncbi:signal peptidase I [Labedella endophytica]|uniref:Signal peptidase I n=1 Tax=Labedella endophytica TaxID=1523160 RepID=A0A433JTZ7_9MICO|nr:signal peptidase I [Labedella endophytica]RUR01449.1 signal peptidase I [Labedella endophytica]
MSTTTLTTRRDARASRTATRPRRPASRVAGDVLLNTLALAGVVCIVLVVLSVFFQITLIMFKTGSMSPTIPTGSVAVVREIPAEDIRVGDVVTVDRAGDLPVTHRVLSVSVADGAPDARTITMQGDANASPDPSPYTVESVRIVLASVPHLASVIVWFSNPVVLGSITLAASALVVWAFWPRSHEEHDEPAALQGTTPR